MKRLTGSVLILVVVEYGLGVRLGIVYKLSSLYVLILVVVEYGLGAFSLQMIDVPSVVS